MSRITPRILALAALVINFVACGGSDKTAPIVAPRLTAEEAILQVSQNYTASSDARRLLAPPSPLAIHQRQVRSFLSLSKGRPAERLLVNERYEYRNGQVVDCTAEGTRSLKASYRFDNDSAAVTLVAPQVTLKYRCTGSTPQELTPTVEQLAVELVLRDETLVVVVPTTDQRRFHPID